MVLVYIIIEETTVINTITAASATAIIVTLDEVKENSTVLLYRSSSHNLTKISKGKQ